MHDLLLVLVSVPTTTNKKMKTSVILTLLVFSLLSATFAAVGRWKKPCPDGRKLGDEWYDDDNCAKFLCKNGTYERYTCGVTDVGDKENCYLEFNTKGHYSACCNADMVCRGDANFNESKIQPK